MTSYLKPQDRSVYQEAEQNILASQTDGRGKLAVRHADPRLRQLEEMQSGQQMDRMLMYGRLGMEKKRMDHDTKMGEGRLDLAQRGQRFNEKMFAKGLGMQKKAAGIAKFGIALNLAMGLGKAVQSYKNQRFQDMQMAELKLQMALLEKQKREMME